MSSHGAPVLYSVDLGDCAALRQLDAEEVEATFVAALGRAGATIVHAMSYVYPGAGLTCALILSESHAVLHTWPEAGTVNIDIFSCSSRLKSLDAITELSRLFGAGTVSIQELPRADGRHISLVS